MFWVKIALWLKYFRSRCDSVIFGLDTSLEEEAMLDCWIFFGGEIKVTMEYFKGSLDIKETNEKVFDLVKEVGYLKKYTYLYLRVIFQKWPKIFFRTRKMKKWDYFFSLNLLDSKISKIREDYNINILSRDERSNKENYLVKSNLTFNGFFQKSDN